MRIVTLPMQSLLLSGIIWTFQEGEYLNLNIYYRDTSSPTSGEVWTCRAVRSISLVMHACPESWISTINWDSFSRVAATFPHLEFLTAAPGDDQFAAYMLHAHHHLKSLCQARGIPLGVPECSACSTLIGGPSPLESTPVMS